MAEFSAGGALSFAENSVNGTTGSFTPGGTNRAIFAAVGTLNFFPVPSSVIDTRYGGSGGTLIDEIGTAYSWLFGSGRLAIFGESGSPSSSTDVFGDWESDPRNSAAGGVCFSGVDQAAPFSGRVDANGHVEAVTTTVAAVTVTGCTSGQLVTAVVVGIAANVLTAFTEVTGTTLRVSSVAGGYLGIAFLTREATGASVTLEVNINGSASVNMTWGAAGVRINDAAGSAPIAALARNANQFLGAYP